MSDQTTDDEAPRPATAEQTPAGKTVGAQSNVVSILKQVVVDTDPLEVDSSGEDDTA